MLLHGDRVDLFFLGHLPALIGQDRLLAKQLLEAHKTVELLLFGLAALHASAALYHDAVEKKAHDQRDDGRKQKPDQRQDSEPVL